MQKTFGQPPQIDHLNVREWHAINCTLVTPLFGGGVDSGEVDAQMPIRASAIRGQLRFWWRLLAKYKWGLNAKEVRQKESVLWGGSQSTTMASLVYLKVTGINQLVLESWANEGRKSVPKPKDWANVPYALFPAQGKPDKNNVEGEAPNKLAKAGLNWELALAFGTVMTEDQKKQVWQTLRWWGSFGGVGARTRRGLGAIQIEYQTDPEKLKPVTQEEVHQLPGFKLVLQPNKTTDVYQAWKAAINALSTFRQSGVGRKDHNSRSYWPEPDAIRRITGQSFQGQDSAGKYKDHKPVHRAREVFPRAAFGLPIIFKFKDSGESTDRDPVSTTLKPVHAKKVFERLSSPLILRPFNDGRYWYAAALLLPHDYLSTFEYRLILQNQSESDGKLVKYWLPEQAQWIKPIHDHCAGTQAPDPLHTFLKYFSTKG